MGVIRIGLLTTANINRQLLATRGDSKAYSFEAVGSRELARAEAYAKEWGIPRSHGSYDAVLADPDLDAVYIALPNVLHHEWTMRALAAGKHVLCEKPYTRNPADVVEAFEEADRLGLVLMEAYMWRHNPQTKLLVELLPRIGELRTIHATFSFVLDWEPDVRLDKALGGGALLDVGCYCVSALRLLAESDPGHVQAEQVLGRGGVDEALSGLLRFGDVFGTFHCGFRSDHRSLTVIGSDGELRAPDPWHSSEARVYLNGEEHKAKKVSSYLLELENFAAAVRGEEEPLLGRADALGQATTIDALLRAAAG